MLTRINQRRTNKRGQSTLEYAILIVIVIGALLSIQFYIKRGIQGRMKSATDDISYQFSPGNTNGFTRTRTTSRTQETFDDGVTTSTLLNDEVTYSSSQMNIINIEQEYFGNPE